MTETLPEPKSRKESYLAKAAGMSVEVPEQPESREEQYLAAIAEGGGGGGTSDFDKLSNRPKYNGTTMTGETNIPEVVTYSDFTGTDGEEAGTSGLVPAPATTDAGKFLKADGTWDTAGGSNYTAGDGIDITNAVISATNTGKAKVLTTADYNWPTNNPDGVALWSLVPGLYQTTTGKVYFNTTDSSQTGSYQYLIGQSNNGSVARIFQPIDGSIYGTTISNGSKFADNQVFLRQSDVRNNLTSTATNIPLSANQGKVLKDLIDSIAIRGAGAPTTSTVGEVGQLYEDGTNGALYQLKSIDITVTPNTYNWEEVGAGGGGSNIIQLTSADYDYPTDGPTRVALWKLADGLYELTDGTNGSWAVGQAINGGDALVMVGVSVGGYKTIVYFKNNEAFLCKVNASTGSAIGGLYPVSLTGPTVVQTTGTSTIDVMSQNATTSMVFADPSTRTKIQIGDGASVGSGTNQSNGIAIGTGASSGDNSASVSYGAIALGRQATPGPSGVAIGNQAYGPAFSSGKNGTIALGHASGDNLTDSGMMDIGSRNTSYGYNSSNYRLLTGLYDGQNAHDAATKGQLDTAILNGGTTAPTTATVGAVGTLYSYVDTTGTPTPHLMVCTEVSGSTYTWTTLI